MGNEVKGNYRGLQDHAGERAVAGVSRPQERRHQNHQQGRQGQRSGGPQTPAGGDQS